MMLSDWRGNEIRAGVTVVYPGRASSSLWMNEGVVTQIAVTTESQYDWREREYKNVEVTKLKVRRADSGKIVTLSVLKRVTVVV